MHVTHCLDQATSTEPPLQRAGLRPLAAAGVLLIAALVVLGVPREAHASTDAPAPLSSSCAGDAGKTINVLHAGSLTSTVQSSLAPEFATMCGASATDQGGPAVGLAEGIKDHSLAGDVYMSADAHVNATLMGKANGDWADWYFAFARNEEVISYTPKSRFFDELERARRGEIPWYQVLTEPGFVLGRTDPNTDPGGYYALFVAQLAERYYKIPGLAKQLLGSDTNPDQLLTPPSYTTTASGATPDATFGYLSGAIDKGQSYITLPAPINLSQPTMAKEYAKARFTNDQGVAFRGAPIYDSVTVLNRTSNEQAAIDFVRLLLSPFGHGVLHSRGFLDTPLLVGGKRGSVPAELRPYIDGRLPDD
jgi:molybdate/tungstate transport system substrate-binding protein